MRRDADLASYVPRVVLEWAADHPDRIARELDGTLVFVDLSGFTAMSEKLSRLGKQGAEDVADIISATFAELLAVAYERDGSLLKFGGDALLLFFQGDAHAARACAAAVAMRRSLRRAGRIRTEAGIVRLRMSVGIHSGTFHLVLAGSSHRELVVLGPGVTRTVEMEHAADAGEILVSAEVAAAVDRRILGEEKAGGFLLRDVTVYAPLVPIAPADTRGLDAAPFVPRAVRDRRATGERDAEHRVATVAFVRFGGTDAMLARDGAEAVATRVARFVTDVQAIVDRHDLSFLASDVDADGGKVFLAAGAPAAHENDDERMLRALREMAELDGLELRIGVHKGPVFAGDIGPAFRRSYSVMGDTVNTAARVMANAPLGGVLATEPVLNHSRTRFEVEELPPFAAKGKARPLVAFLVGPPTGRARVEGAVAEMVGRDGDLARLSDALNADGGGIVALLGEPGIGKSRLVEELLGQTDATVLRVWAERYDEAVPYAVARQILRPILGLTNRAGQGDDEAITAAIGELPGDVTIDLDPLLAVIGGGADLADEMHNAQAWTRRLASAVGGVLDALLPRGAVVVLEDAQWVDPATAALLRALAPRFAAARWALLLVTRPGAAVEDLASRAIVLEPIDHAASLRLARAAAPRPLLPAEAQAIAERGAGHPAFIRELASAYDPDAGVDSLPVSLEATIAARIDALAPDDRYTLRRLAVLGTRFDAEWLSSLDADGDLRRLREFVDRRDDVIAFKGSLFRDVAYSQLPFRQRRELHLRVGRFLEAKAVDTALLSLHFHEARDPQRTWRYARAAGDDAAARRAFPEAAYHYRRALASARQLGDAIPPSEVASVSQSLGVAMRNAGRLVEARAAFRSARRLVRNDQEATARLCLFEADLQHRSGRQPEALRWARRGVAALADAEASVEARRLRVRLHQQIALARIAQQNHREAMRWLVSSLEEAEANGDLAGVAHACNFLVVTSAALRDETGAAFGSRALELYRKLGSAEMEAQTLNNLALLSSKLRRLDEARELYERARDTLTRLGDVLAAAVAANNVGEILAEQGHLDDAARTFEEALETFTAAKHGYRSAVLSNLGRVASRKGELARGAALLEEARVGLAAMGAEGLVAEVDARDAERVLLEGRGREAFDAARALLDRAPSTLVPMLHRIAAGGAIVLGDREGARDHLVAAAAAARMGHDDLEAALAEGLLAWLEGRTGDVMDAAAILARLGVVAVAMLPPGARPAAPADGTAALVG